MRKDSLTCRLKSPMGLVHARVHPLTVYIVNPLTGLKADEAGPEGTLKPQPSGANVSRPRDQIPGLFGGHFTSFKSSLTGLYHEGGFYS